jgi:hypothetical protein
MILMSLFFASLYFIPVIALICIPNRISWLIITTILLCLSPYRAILAEIYRPKVAAIVFVVIFPALLMKILAIWIRNSGKIGLARILPFIGLIGPIFFLSNVSKFEEFFRENPISQSCVMNVLRPEIDGYNFLVSPVNRFNIKQNIANTAFRESELGSLCKLTDNGKESFPAENITFHFPHKYDESDFCQPGQDEWKRIVCLMDDDQPNNVSYQTKISIFKKGQSAAQIIPGLPRLDYDSTFKYFEKLKMETVEDLQNPGFYILKREIGTEEIWITKNEEWKTPDGNLYATSCSPHPNGAVCITSYQLNDKLTLRYSFATSFKEIEQRAKLVDETVNKAIAAWLTPKEKSD